jgi:hypothetical protein
MNGMVTCRCGFVELEHGETCTFCGHKASGDVENFYYFSNTQGNWILCRTESFCKKMAEQGHMVKKVVFRSSQ